MKRTILVSGTYGSGKSEFSVNLALHLSYLGYKVQLADLDIINPYFRSVEAQSVLKENNVHVISTSFEGQMDLPAVSGEVFSMFNDKESFKILDLGGDEEGARILGYLKDQLEENDFDFWVCVNANRRESNTKEKVLDLIHRLEHSSKQKVTGVVNTTHLMADTTKEDILKGYQLAKSMDYPLIYNVIKKDIDLEIENRFDINIYLKKPWEV